MRRYKSYIITLAALILVLSISGIVCQASKPVQPTAQPKLTETVKPEPIELSLSHMYPPTAVEAKIYDMWAERLASESNGLLTVRVYPGNTLITTPPEVIEGVKAGVADIGSAAVYKPEGFEISYSLTSVLTAPSSTIADKIYKEMFDKFPDAMNNEWNGVKVLWLIPLAPQTYMFTDRKVQTLDDWKGLQLRVPSQEGAEQVKAMGGSPVSMTTPDLVTALQKGTVQGALQMWCAANSNKMTDLKYAVMIRNDALHGIPTPIFCIMNQETWDSLHPDFQKIIDDSLEWGRAKSIELWCQSHDESVAWFESVGGENYYVSPEEEAKWIAIRNKLQAETMKRLDEKGLPGTEILELIHQRLKDYAQ